MSSANIEGNGTNAMKYSTVRVKEETSKRLYRYIGKRTQDEGERVTADDAITELLNSAGVE